MVRVTLATSREPAFKAKLMLPNTPQGMLTRVEKLEKATLGGLRMPSAEACLVQMLCVCVCVCVSACVSVAVSYVYVFPQSFRFERTWTLPFRYAQSGKLRVDIRV